MSDYETLTHKACSLNDLAKSLKAGGGLVSRKVSAHGISCAEGIMVSDPDADLATEFLASKYGPAVAIKVLKKPPAMKHLERKRSALKEELSRIEGNGGRGYIARNNLIGSFGFCAREFYKHSVFQSAINRVLESKQNTKSCRECGHVHKTNPKDHNLSISGCNECKSQFFLFSEVDRKKHCSALNKLGPVKAELAELETKRTEKLEETINSKNWYWFIGAHTKAIADRCCD